MRGLHALQLTIVCSWVGGCFAHAATPVSRQAAASSPRPVAPQPATVSEPAPSTDELIVGSERGVEAWQSDGAGKRMISPGPALQPRWLDRDTLLVLHPSAEPGDAALERVSLHDGARQTIARLPAFSCVEPGATQGEPIALRVHSFTDFTVDSAKQLACVARMDRNYNMAEVRLSTRVDLRTSAASSWLELFDASCQVPQGVLAGDPPEESECEGAESLEPDPDARYPYAFDDGTLWELSDGAQRTAKLVLADYYAEHSSPSGRWLVLSGDVEEGDYMYRRVVLLDRRQGQIFAIPEAAGPLSAPLTAAEGTPPRIATPLTQTALITAETDVHWLPPHSSSELLVLGALIVIPGERSFSIAGELAR
jgi:hypothetical protein